MTEIVLVYTTWPDPETAETVGAACVEAGLAACVNILAPLRAVFRWDGAVQTAQETPMILKTSRARVQALRDFVIARHPYETPAVVALATLPEGTGEAFADWVGAEVGTG
jgi:periplasmic divalent cation tolerance protein